METCDQCGREVPLEELTAVARPDGTLMQLCRDCYERSAYAPDEDDA
jgi:ribosome-binding protein aMBF1 (putative translation factor)